MTKLRGPSRFFIPDWSAASTKLSLEKVCLVTLLIPPSILSISSKYGHDGKCLTNDRLLRSTGSAFRRSISSFFTFRKQGGTSTLILMPVCPDFASLFAFDRYWSRTERSRKRACMLLPAAGPFLWHAAKSPSFALTLRWVFARSITANNTSGYHPSQGWHMG